MTKDSKEGVVRIDTLSTNMQGNENSVTDVKWFLHSVREMIREFGCTVIIIHDVGHKNKKRMRGSRALSEGADAVFRISKEGDMKATLHSPDVVRRWKAPEDIHFKLEKVKISAKGDSLVAVQAKRGG